MTITGCVGVFMLVMSLIFWVAAARNSRRAATGAIAGRVYRRTATVFALVGIGLYVLPSFPK
jgi:hypothetical protein